MGAGSFFHKKGTVQTKVKRIWDVVDQVSNVFQRNPFVKPQDNSVTTDNDSQKCGCSNSDCSYLRKKSYGRSNL